MKRVYDIGIIGLGRIASLMEEDRYGRRYYKYLTHAGVFTKHPGFNIKCASDINLKRLRVFGEKWGVKKLYNNYNDMLNKESLDLLIISTPPDTHAGIIKNSAGKVKLILSEKPLAKDFKEAKEIVSICKRQKTKLAVNLQRRYDPAHNRIRDYINSKKFGTIKRINCFYGKGIYNSGSHLVDILLYFIGEIRYVQVLHNIKQRYAEPTPDIFIMFGKKIPCLIQAVDYDDYRMFEIDIFGARERIRVEDEGLKIVHFKRFPNRSEKGAFELSEIKPKIEPTIGEAFYYMAENMFQALNRDIAPLCSGEDYLKVGQVIDGIIESMQKGGTRVNIER